MKSTNLFSPQLNFKFRLKNREVFKNANSTDRTSRYAHNQRYGVKPRPVISTQAYADNWSSFLLCIFLFHEGNLRNHRGKYKFELMVNTVNEIDSVNIVNILVAIGETTIILSGYA